MAQQLQLNWANEKSFIQIRVKIKTFR